MAGRPKGALNKDKPWAEALRMALFANDRRDLRAIAETCKAAALAGDMQAIKEIGDRLDGKPAVEITSESTIRYVARIPEKAADADTWQKQHSPSITMQ